MIDISPVHLETVKRILGEHVPDCEVRAFGSRVTWTAKDHSDLDLAVVGAGTLDADTLRLLKEAFEESDLPFRVDVIDWHAISENFRKVVEKKFEVIQKGKRKDGSGGGGFILSKIGLSGEALPEGWRIDRLDTIADFNPDQIGKDYCYSTIEYLDISNVSKGMLGKPDSLDLAKAPSRAKRIIKNHDTILSTVRPGNRAYAFVKQAPPNMIVSTGFSVLRAKNNNSPRFVYYLSTCDSIIDYLASIAEEKTAYPSVNPRDIAECLVPIPPVAEQRAIAHILGTLDDKIDLNRRMNESLEAMARALFKSWFVDFDPVRAKMEGRWRKGESLPGLPAHLYDLFPDRLVDSELGEIPEGWEVGKFGDVAENPRRSVVPQKIKPDMPYIALEHMPKCHIALSDWGIAVGVESNKFEFKKGEILFGKLRPYFHKVGVAPIDGVCSTDIVVVKPNIESWFGFVLGHISSREFVEYTNAGSIGTKMPRTSWTIMEKYEIVIPSEKVVKAFNSMASLLIERINKEIYETHTLDSIRDTLLPKLISGEVRVKEKSEFEGVA